MRRVFGNVVGKIARFWFGDPPPPRQRPIDPDPGTREQVIEKARKLVEERGWMWRDPVEVSASDYKGEPVWDVRVNTLSRGMNAWVVLRRSDHSIIHAWCTPR
jgi:hypothetical protein